MNSVLYIKNLHIHKDILRQNRKDIRSRNKYTRRFLAMKKLNIEIKNSMNRIFFCRRIDIAEE